MSGLELPNNEPRSTYDLQVLQINSVVTYRDKEVGSIIGEGVVLETKLASDVWWSKFDLKAMSQVYLNLVVNACEAMPEGGRLTVETSNVILDDQYVADYPEIQGEYVLLAVHDTGCGINDDIKEYIFEPFYTTKGEEHAGLGLPMVWGHVKQFGGQIRVDSEQGFGSTFKIYLPWVEKSDSSEK